jgi:hypothetical protein
MLKKLWLLLPLFGALAAMGTLSGCFQSPTNPFVSAFEDSGGANSGGNFGGGGVLPTPTPGGGGVFPTPTPGGGGGTGSISGTVSGSHGESVQIIAVLGGSTSTIFTTTRSGDGAYTISNVVDGTYYVGAESTTYVGAYAGLVTISGGNAATGINITMN